MAFCPLRVPLLAVVALVAALPITAAVCLGRGLLRPGNYGRLETLQRFGCGGEILRQRRNGDLLACGALDIAKVAALVG